MVALLVGLALRLTLSTMVAVEPATVTARAVIPPDAANRGACVSVWERGADAAEQESCWALNGARESASFSRTFARLLAGEYVVRLVVRTTHGDLVRTAPLLVG